MRQNRMVRIKQEGAKQEKYAEAKINNFMRIGGIKMELLEMERLGSEHKVGELAPLLLVHHSISSSSQLQLQKQSRRSSSSYLDINFSNMDSHRVSDITHQDFNTANILSSIRSASLLYYSLYGAILHPECQRRKLCSQPPCPPLSRVDTQLQSCDVISRSLCMRLHMTKRSSMHPHMIDHQNS